MTYARLRNRWASMPDTLYAGAWYPVVDRIQYKPTRLDDVVFVCEDEEITMASSALELDEAPHELAVWGIGRPPSGQDPGIGGAVVCPKGHATTGVAPWASAIRCGKCAADYPIKAPDAHYRPGDAAS